MAAGVPAAPEWAALTRPGLIAAVAVALLTALPVAFRGLYFPPQQLLALVGACLVAALVWWARGPVIAFFRDRVDIAALAIAGSYLLSLTVAAHPQSAIQSWLLRLLYFLVFWCAGEVSRLGIAGRRIVIWGLLLGGAIVLGSGVAAAAGAFASHGFFLGNRLYTSIQYPDAAAAYLAAVAFVALGAQLSATRLWVRVGYALAAATFLFGFVFALSRGAVLAFLPVVLIFLIFQGRGRWADGIAALVGALLGVAAGALPYLHGIAGVAAKHADAGLMVWGGVLVVCIVSGLAALAWQWWRETRGRLRLASGLGAVAVALLALAAAFVRLSHGLLSRLGRVSLQDYNAWSRLRWMEDAWRLVMRHPVLGLGGGGWAAAYQSVQSYYYTSTQVHNGWLQTWVSTGTVGMLCYLAFWALLLHAAWRAWHLADPAQRPLVVGLAAGVLMLGAHSAIDFTLSLGGITIGLMTMAGLLRSLALPAAEPAHSAHGGHAGGGRGAGASARASRMHWPDVRVTSRRGVRSYGPAEPARPLAAIAFYGSLAGLMVFALVLWTGGRRIAQATRDGQAGQMDSAQQALQAAIADDPWSATAYFDLAEVQATLAGSAQANSTAQIQDLDAANADYQQALALDPYGVIQAGQLHTYYALFLQATGRSSQALSQLHQAVADGPYQATSYDSLDLGLVDQAVVDARGHQVAAGRRVLLGIAQAAAERAARVRAVPPEAVVAQKDGQLAAFPASDPAMQLAAGEAAALEGAWSSANAQLSALSGQAASIGGEANLWLSFVKAHLKQPTKAVVAAAKADLGSSYAAQYALVKSVVGALAPLPAAATKPKAGSAKAPQPKGGVAVTKGAAAVSVAGRVP